MQTARTLAALVAAVGMTSFGDVVFEENFRNYKDTVPGITEAEGIELINEPVWYRAAWLVVKPKASFPLFKEGIRLPDGNRFDLLVDVSFESPAAPAEASYFDLALAKKGGKTQAVRIAADAIGGAKIDRLGNGQWVELAVKADGANADIYISKAHDFTKVASVKLADTFDTLNFAVTAEKGFSLRNLVVRTPEALPDYSAASHFAAFKSLTQPLEGAKVAASNETVTLPKTDCAGLRLVLGSTNAAATVSVAWSSGVATKYTYRAGTFKDKPRSAIRGKPGNTEHLFDETVIDCSNQSLRQFVRPYLWSYGSFFGYDQKAHDILREWDTLPRASQHVLDLDFVRRVDGNVEAWIDGSFRGLVPQPRRYKDKDGKLPPPPVATDISIAFSEGVKYALKGGPDAGVDKSRFTLLDLAANPRAKAFADAELVEGGAAGVRALPDGVPVRIAKPLDSADIGICEASKWGSFSIDDYLGRTPEHGYPSAVHYRLPSAVYTKAHVVFALDPDKRKDAVMNVRLSHFINHGVGIPMIANTTVDLSEMCGGGTPPPPVKKVGEIVKDGKKLPLYAATIDLDIGKIVDFVTRYDYMDLDIVGKCLSNMQQRDLSCHPDPNSKSAFNLFAITLEKLPVAVDFVQSAKSNAFTIDEEESVRKTAVMVKATADDVKGAVAWVARDAEGREAFRGEKAFALVSAGASNVVDVALGGVGVGFYTLDWTVSVAGKGSFIHHARFAILPPSGRKVKTLDSPYATWRFGNGNLKDEFAADGPVLQKAGIRRAAFQKYTPENCEKYGISSVGSVVGLQLSDFDEKTGKFKPRTIMVPDPGDPTGRKKVKKDVDGEGYYVNWIQERIDQSVNIDHVMIWHESAPWNPIPEELLGRPLTEESKKQIEGDRVLVDFIRESCRIIRKHFPNLRVEIGNSGASIGAVVRPLRVDKGVASCYDRVSTEICAQTIPPERLIEVGLQGSIIARDAFEAIAGKRPRTNGCYEFAYRPERDIGERRQAEYYVRDLLVCLSHRFDLISPGVFYDVPSPYYSTVWGAAGILLREPYGYPKQAYAAYAALTYALDGVTFIRPLDTGSSTVYALEFKRCDGQYAYAFWSARGEVRFEIDAEGEGRLIGFFGDERKLASGRSAVDGGTSPVYFVSGKALKGVRIAGRAFAADERIAAGAKVAAKLDKAADCILEPDPFLKSTTANFLPIYEPGDFALREVKDEEKGDCLEIALNKKDGERVSNYITEYTTLRLKEPKALAGEPELIGVWVKGNSNWGQVHFEIEDAEGEVFKGMSTGKSWCCDIYDWPGNTAVNFDGWSYVYTCLRETDLIPTRVTVSVAEQWVADGRRNKKIDFPVKVRAISIGMNRHKLNLNEFEESAPAIRVRDVGGR